LGLGGHAKLILERTGPAGKLLGLDRDQEALKIAQERLKIFGERVILQQGSFHQITQFLPRHQFSQVHGMLLDLGVSSMQFEDAKRGFSFLKDSALDMRMDLEEE